MPQHVVAILFLFALGACVGSFLNVVVWRLPRGESLVSPPSHCPKCNTPLKWYDNVPVLGWLKLGGKCRFCKEPISARYPVVEAVTGGLFVFYYVAFYLLGTGPCAPASMTRLDAFGLPDSWPIYLLYMLLVSCLLAASLIDAEQFIIPIEIPWLAAIIGIIVHAAVDRPTLPGALNLGPLASATAAGAGVGLAFSMVLWRLNVFPTSFPEGEPMFENDREAYLEEIEANRKKGIEMPPAPPPYTSLQVRLEMLKEVLFLTPPVLLAAGSALLALSVPGVETFWTTAPSWLTGLLGAILGACVGGFVVWLFRILGTLAFGRLAMGLGDVHLMLGVGAIVGAGAATVAFFLAPFAGLAIAVWRLLTKGRRELPFGPYLSLATAVGLLFYCDIAAYLTPGLEGLTALLMGNGAGGR